MKQSTLGKQLNIRSKPKKNLNSIIKIFGLLALMGLLIFFYTTVSGSTREEERAMCEAETDVVLIMDRSGSMEEGGADSICVWYVREETASSTQFKKKTAQGESEEWCLEKIDENIPDQYEQYYEESRDNKITAAKGAAKSFVDLLGEGDQSSLVYFSYYFDGIWTAKLEKILSSNHQSTKNSIEALTTDGATNIGDAIDLANQELTSVRANPQATKAAILLTDGMANKPSGPGHGEHPEDVEYAINKATTASALGIKIFTIGLGSDSDINEQMLQQIADITDAFYYPSPDQEELASIYQEISQRLCDYGSISGCKFNDVNRSGEWDEGEEYLPEWEIILTNNKATTTQITDEQGCYKFSGLAGDYDYLLQETVPDNWTQTHPEAGKYQVSLAWEEHVGGYDFGNYYQDPDPDPGSLRIKKWEDGDGSASTTEDRSLADSRTWTFLIDLWESTSTPLTATTSDGETVVGDLAPGVYSIEEQLLSDWEVLIPESGMTTTTIVSGQESLVEFVNYYHQPSNNNGGGNGGGDEDDDEEDPVCGNGIVENGEECDDGNTKSGDGCSSACKKEKQQPAPSGGGSTPYWMLNPPAPQSPEPQLPQEPIVEGEEGKPDLLITKTADKNTVNHGEEINYVVTIINQGNLSAFNVELRDDLPQDFVYKGDTDPLWLLGDMAPGEEKSVDYKAVVSDAASEGVHTNVARAEADNHDAVTATSEVEVKKVIVLPMAGFDPKELIYLIFILAVLSGLALKPGKPHSHER